LFGDRSQLVVYHFMFGAGYTAGCPYSSGGRGVEFLMGYYPILDRVPNGRDEGDGFQTWLRRHDEYA
jgi:predicted dithiol-disulfide oxidoreductase (DUF899 family)